MTHKEKIEKVSTKEDKELVRQSTLGDNVEPLEQEEEDKLLEAYRQTFDLIDSDVSGAIERVELEVSHRFSSQPLLNQMSQKVLYNNT